MGKMIDAQSIVVSASTTGQAGNESQILRYVFWHSLALACLISEARSFRWLLEILDSLGTHVHVDSSLLEHAPQNTSRCVNEHRALKSLRGDFQDMPHLELCDAKQAEQIVDAKRR